MERRAPLMMGTLLRQLAAGALVLVLLAVAGPARAQERLVLVVGAKSPVSALSLSDVHKLFVGLTVVANDQRLQPLRNDSDDLMRRVFFQSIVSMSEAVYDRRMLALTLQQGRTAPPVARSAAEVIQTLEARPDVVSFLWASDAERDPRVRILRDLWHP